MWARTWGTRVVNVLTLAALATGIVASALLLLSSFADEQALTLIIAGATGALLVLSVLRRADSAESQSPINGAAVPVVLVALFAGLVVLSGVDSILRTLKAPGANEAGIATLTGGFPRPDPATAAEAIKGWLASQTVAARAVTSHGALDSLAVVPLLVAFLAFVRGWARRRLYPYLLAVPPPDADQRLVLALGRVRDVALARAGILEAASAAILLYAVSDLAENITQALVFAKGGGAAVWVLWSLTAAKLASLIFAVAGPALVVAGIELGDLLDSRSEVRAMVKRRSAARQFRAWTAGWLSAARPLVVPLTAVSFYAVLVLSSALPDQLPDVLRGWIPSGQSVATHLLAATIGLVALNATLWVVVTDALNTCGTLSRRGSLPNAVFLLGGAAVTTIGIVLDIGVKEFRPAAITSLGIILLVIGIASGLGGAPFWEGNEPDQTPRRPLVDPERTRTIGALILLAPGAATGIAAVSAAAAPLVVTGADSFLSLALLGALLLGAAGIATLLWWESGDSQLPLWAQLALLLILLVAGVIVGASVELAIEVGSVAIIGLFLATATLALHLLGELGDHLRPPRGLRIMGFTRTPFVVLLIAWVILASQLDREGFHDSANTNTQSESTTPATGLPVSDIYDRWVQCQLTDRAVPMVFVASSGGGVRAAYWTLAAYERLVDLVGTTRPPVSDECDNRSGIFAVSGISGGSLGLMYLMPAWLDGQRGLAEGARKEYLDNDFLAPALAAMFYLDLPRSVTRAPAGDDRARRLELAWTKDNPELSRHFLATQLDRTGMNMPIVILNGTTVETGCRFNVSNVDSDPQTSDQPANCRRQADTSIDPDLVTTHDLTDFLCDDQDVELATAALLSARFPFVSPSGRLSQCGSAPLLSTYVVDGGYADRAGASALVELYGALEPAIARHNAVADASCIVPVYFQLENSYQQTAGSVIFDRTTESGAPLAAAQSASTNRDFVIAQTAARAFTGTLPGFAEGAPSTDRYIQLAPTAEPGIQAPLGWSLSEAARQQMDEAASKLEIDAQILELLRGELSCADFTS